MAGRAWEALVDWRDSGLIVSKETLLERCPEYYTLLEDWLLRNEEAADTIVEDSGEITSVFSPAACLLITGKKTSGLSAMMGPGRFMP